MAKCFLNHKYTTFLVFDVNNVIQRIFKFHLKCFFTVIKNENVSHIRVHGAKPNKLSKDVFKFAKFFFSMMGC